MGAFNCVLGVKLPFPLFHDLQKGVWVTSPCQGVDTLINYWDQGKAEVLSLDFGEELVNFNDVDHARDLGDHQSVSTLVHLMNGFAVVWECWKEQATALFVDIFKTKIIKVLSRSKQTESLARFII